MIMSVILCISILVYIFILKHALGTTTLKGLISFVIYGILSFSLHGIFFIISTIINFSWSLTVALLIVIAVIYILKFRKEIFADFPKKISISSGTIVFSFLSLYGIYLFKIFSIKYGGWDAFAIWNSHSKFLANSELWGNMLDPALKWSHNEYPLLFPSFTAMFWRLTDTCNPIIPVINSLIFFITLLSILYKSVSGKVGKILSLVAIILIITNTDIIIKISSQYADSVVALFYLITLFLLYKLKNEDKKSFILIGIVASLNCWIKNEGFVFFVLVSIVLFINNIKNIRVFLNYCYGAVPLFLLHLSYGYFYTEKSDLSTTSYDQLLLYIKDPLRYEIILKKLESLINFEFALIPICVFICLLFLKRKAIKELPLLIIGAIFIAYCTFFVITPFDINWHLDTALDRLILQCYPSILMITAVVVNSHYNKTGFFK